MKVPKVQNKYCPKCRKHTSHTIIQGKKGVRSALTPGTRRKNRCTRGHGEHGKFSKKPVSEQKRSAKSVKKQDLRYKCNVCGKSTVQKRGVRVKKFEIVRTV